MNKRIYIIFRGEPMVALECNDDGAEWRFADGRQVPDLTAAEREGINALLLEHAPSIDPSLKGDPA